MLVEGRSDLGLYLGISVDAGMLGRQVLSVYGQLNPDIWGRTLGLGPISQDGQPERGRLGSRNRLLSS